MVTKLMYGIYKNNPKEFSTKVVSLDLEPIVICEFENVKSNQQVFVDLDKYEFLLDGNLFHIGASKNNSVPGVYEVSEKWEYPYWRRTDGIYTPADDNPIGRYLVILRDTNTGKKINTGLHSFTRLPNRNVDFYKGAQTEGCITFKPEDMENIFKTIELGAKVNLYKSSIQEREAV